MGVARQLPVNRVCVQLHCKEGAFANRILLLQLKPFQKKRESPGKFVPRTPHVGTRKKGRRQGRSEDRATRSMSDWCDQRAPAGDPSPSKGWTYNEHVTPPLVGPPGTLGKLLRERDIVAEMKREEAELAEPMNGWREQPSSSFEAPPSRRQPTVPLLQDMRRAMQRAHDRARASTTAAAAEGGIDLSTTHPERTTPDESPKRSSRAKPTLGLAIGIEESIEAVLQRADVVISPTPTLTEGGLSLERAFEMLEEDGGRPRLLERLRVAGVARLPDRQAIANALSREVRERRAANQQERDVEV
jgi:hypothetical protein